MITSGFFNSIDGDRKYNAEQMSAIFNGIITDGVFMNIGACFKVEADVGRTIKVGTGKAWLNGLWLENDAIYLLESDLSNLLAPRIDAVILEVDHSAAIRDGRILILKGLAGTNPNPPALEKGPMKWQYPLAYITRPANNEVIQPSYITNKVGSSELPYVTGILKTVNTDQLLAQWGAEWVEWFENLHNLSDEGMAEFESKWREWFATIQSQTAAGIAGNQAAWDDWFGGVRDTLTEDAAGNLYLKIEEVETNVKQNLLPVFYIHKTRQEIKDTLQGQWIHILRIKNSGNRGISPFKLKYFRKKNPFARGYSDFDALTLFVYPDMDGYRDSEGTWVDYRSHLLFYPEYQEGRPSPMFYEFRTYVLTEDDGEDYIYIDAHQYSAKLAGSQSSEEELNAFEDIYFAVINPPTDANPPITMYKEPIPVNEKDIVNKTHLFTYRYSNFDILHNPLYQTRRYDVGKTPGQLSASDVNLDRLTFWYDAGFYTVYDNNPGTIPSVLKNNGNPMSMSVSIPSVMDGDIQFSYPSSPYDCKNPYDAQTLFMRTYGLKNSNNQSIWSDWAKILTDKNGALPKLYKSYSEYKSNDRTYKDEPIWDGGQLFLDPGLYLMLVWGRIRSTNGQLTNLTLRMGGYSINAPTNSNDRAEFVFKIGLFHLTDKYNGNIRIDANSGGSQASTFIPAWKELGMMLLKLGL